ncbi:unnamed protein product [Rotaria socialis]|uniref:SUEL-type lectin domain-containing protein n=1 Tax=Rotaria socialis TaxID=392032 RepID=A0A817QM61_9BILA|nr:unnamed protein product [Rotaria socialis]CAF4275988.1 unnamed protein product [Rotaria socialis]CAF4453411.1 unnamed protein product [Rotaria socialis]
MDYEDNSVNNGYQSDEKDEATRVIEDDTYTISDSESTTNVTSLIDTNVIQGELNQSTVVQLRLRCSLYEHIEIIRVIYGYSKQRLTNQCQFSIYDCIQEGASENILSCNGKQTCAIDLTKTEMFSTTITTKGVPTCSDFNYVQVNFGCVLDAKDICDSWKDEAAIIHLSHTNSKEKQHNECQCKVRSSLSSGQVLLRAREINRQFGNLKDLRPSKDSNTNCKTTTYLEISTDRSERKCMDNLPSNGNALFGSGSHNFTLNYIRNDPSSELFFYFELTASPIKSDHYVQIICNWARRTTTVRTTLARARKRKLTTINMSYGLKLSRLDLIRHPPTSNDNLEVDEDASISSAVDVDETEATTVINEPASGEDEETDTAKNHKIKPLKSKKKGKAESSKAISIETTTTDTLSVVNDEQWLPLLSADSFDSLSASEQFFPFNNDSFMNSAQASIVPVEQQSRMKLSKAKVFMMSSLLVSITTFILCIYCVKVTQCGCIQRLKINFTIALLFCCEAGKLLFSSSNKTNSNTPTSTIDRYPHHNRHRRSPSLPADDYRSADYYMNHTVNNFHTMQSIYDYDGGGGGGEKSVYNIDNYTEDNYGNQPPRSMYTTQYDRYSAVDTC